MTSQQMTYRQLQISLRVYREQGLTAIRLNSKKAALQAEYDRIARLAESTEDRIMAIVEAHSESRVPLWEIGGQLEISRAEFLEALYALQSSDRLELSTVVEAYHYTDEQLSWGIPQAAGGDILFAEIL